MRLMKPRRKMIVNQELQFDVLMYVAVFVFSLFIVQTAVAGIFIYHLSEYAQELKAHEFIDRYKVGFLIWQGASLCVSLALGVSFFNRLTSRIAGPLYNIRKTLRQARNENADVVQIRLREDDYFQNEVRDINESLHKKWG